MRKLLIERIGGNARYALPYCEYCDKLKIDYRCTQQSDVDTWVENLNDEDLLKVYDSVFNDNGV